jgi:hypothetical protein
LLRAVAAVAAGVCLSPLVPCLHALVARLPCSTAAHTRLQTPLDPVNLSCPLRCALHPPPLLSNMQVGLGLPSLVLVASSLLLLILSAAAGAAVDAQATGAAQTTTQAGCACLPTWKDEQGQQHTGCANPDDDPLVRVCSRASRMQRAHARTCGLELTAGRLTACTPHAC